MRVKASSPNHWTGQGSPHFHVVFFFSLCACISFRSQVLHLKHFSEMVWGLRWCYHPPGDFCLFLPGAACTSRHWGQGILNHLNLTSGTKLFLCHPGNSELSLNPCEGNLLLVPLILWYKPSGFPTQRPEGLLGLPLLRPWAPIVVSQVPWGCLQHCWVFHSPLLEWQTTPGQKLSQVLGLTIMDSHLLPDPAKRFFTVLALQCLQADIFIFCSTLLVALSRRALSNPALLEANIQ